MTTPNILEIILLSIIGLAVFLYLIKSLYEIRDKIKNPQKYAEKQKKKEKELDD